MSSPVSWIERAFTEVPRAMEGGLLAAASCGAGGAFLRWRRLVWAGFAVPQAATAGTAFALGSATLFAALGVAAPMPAWMQNETLWGLVATAIAVAFLVPVGRAAGRGGERAAAMTLVVAATATVLFVSESPHGIREVEALATGRSLLFLSPEDLDRLRVAVPAVLVACLVAAGPLSAIAFDRDHARAAGRRVVAWEAGMALGLLLLVALVTPACGAPFVFAYLTLPAAAAERDVARPLAVVLVASALGVLGFLLGAGASIAWDLPFATAAIGGAVVVDGVAILGSFAVRRSSRAMREA